MTSKMEFSSKHQLFDLDKRLESLLLQDNIFNIHHKDFFSVGNFAGVEKM